MKFRAAGGTAPAGRGQPAGTAWEKREQDGHAAVEPWHSGDLFPSRGTACRRAGEPSLERQDASPLYFFKGSRFQCFPGEDKLAQREKKK